jgi:hypothetical protein
MRFKTNIERKNWLKYNNGGPTKKSMLDNSELTYTPSTDAMNAMMKARLAYANEFGNPSAKRMVVAPDQPYVYTGEEYDKDFDRPAGVPAGSIGTHYMAEFDNYAVPFIQQGPDGLYFNESPSISDKEAIRFDSPEDASYFAGHYKDIAPDPLYREEENIPETYNLQRALELGYTPDETGHMPSVDEETGMWLKSSDHETAWKEYLYGSLNKELGSNYNVRVNPEGYFGERQLQYVPKTYGGKVPNIPTWNYPSKGTPIYRDTTEIPSNKFPHGGYHSSDISEEPKPINPYYNIQALQDKDLEFYDKWQGHVEYDPIGLQLTADVFRNIDSVHNAQTVESYDPKIAFKTERETPHWSAATTSSLAMALLGANTVEEARAKGFRPSAAHKDYIQDAIITDLEDEQNQYNFYRAGKLDEKTLNNLEIGELIFKGRYSKEASKNSKGWKYDDFKKAAKEDRKYASHSDIIVGKGEDENGKYIEVSGGNVGDTYLHKKKYYLDEVARTYAGAMKFSEMARNQQLLSTDGPDIAELPTMPIQSMKDNVPTMSRKNIMSLDDIIKAKEAKRQFMQNKILEATKNKIY